MLLFYWGGEHRVDWITTYPFNGLIDSFNFIKGHPLTKGDVYIGNDVWIARDAKIMSGVTIGDGCVIAANALVTSDMPPYSVYGGVPAKLIKYRFSHSNIKKLIKMQWWNWEDEILCNAIPILQSKSINEIYDYYKIYVYS